MYLQKYINRAVAAITTVNRCNTATHRKTLYKRRLLPLQSVMKTNTGFTLVELLTALTVLAILLSLAVPSFRETIMNNRLSIQANEFITAINVARSEAVKQAENITITSKNGTDWSQGWTITDSGGTALRDHNALEGTSTLTGGVSSIQYESTGFITGGSTLTFDLCDTRTGETGTRVTILVTGRPSSDELSCS